MATYKETKGVTVQTRDEDPVGAGGSWSSGGNINNLRYGTGQAGTSTAGSIFFGYVPAGNSVTVHEYYDGTSFTEQTDGNTARESIFGCGTQTASIAAGGDAGGGNRQALTETWNGSSWTEVADLNTARNTMGSLGHVNTAGLAFGGVSPGGSDLTITEQWNGSAWTETGDLNQGGYGSSGSGTSTSGIKITIQHPSAGSTKTVEQWDGSSWTEIADVNNTHAPGSQASQQGTYNQALVAGGSTYSVNTESWDGSSWTEVNNLSTGRSQGSGFGTYTDMVVAAGQTTSAAYITASEEWSAPAVFQKTIQGQLFFNSTTNTFKETLLDAPGGTWAAGGDLNSGRNTGMGAGASLNAGLCFGGPPIPPSPASRALTEQYNGTSWTEVNDLNSGKKLASSASSAPYSDTLNFAGDTSPSPVYSKTNESWDGTSWTEQADLNVAGNAAAGVGSSSTAALRAAGQSTATPPGGPHYTGTEVWNGSSWTEVNEVNTSRRYLPGMGTTSAGLITGGDTDNPSFPGGRYTGRTESWNGTSWTEVNDLNSGRFCSGAGTQTLSIAFGGGPPQGVLTEAWDGTSWTEVSDMTYPSQNSAPGGSGVSALRMGGETASAPNNDKTEEWSGGLANKTITLS